MARGRGTPATEDDARAEITDTVLRVARRLAANPRNVFGYYDREDIEQEGCVFALDALNDGKYDTSLPLENFLNVVVRTRLSNLKRNSFMRCERPCGCCDPFGGNEVPCRKFLDWQKRNAAKQSLMSPVDVSEDLRAGGTTPEAEASLRETLVLIDETLPVALRADYLRMRSGTFVPKDRRARVREAVAAILGDQND